MINNKKSELIPHLKTTNEIGDESFAFNDLEKAYALNNYVSVHLETRRIKYIFVNVIPKTPHNLSDIRIEESEKAHVKNTFITNKVCGEDQKLSKVIKPLCLLFNSSHNECHFPPPLEIG